MLIDRHMPRPDVHDARHATILAHPEEAFDAFGSARITDPILRLAFVLGRMPSRIEARSQGRTPVPLPRHPTVKALAWRGDVVVLDELPGSEAVSGLVLELRRFRPPRIRRVATSEFDAFGEPGHVKIVMGFSARPYGGARSLATLDARAEATDEGARRLLDALWRLGTPARRYGLDRVLDAVKREAEGLPPAPPTAPSPPDANARKGQPRP